MSQALACFPEIPEPSDHPQALKISGQEGAEREQKRPPASQGRRNGETQNIPHPCSTSASFSRLGGWVLSSKQAPSAGFQGSRDAHGQRCHWLPSRIIPGFLYHKSKLLKGDLSPSCYYHFSLISPPWIKRTRHPPLHLSFLPGLCFLHSERLEIIYNFSFFFL